MYFEKYQDNRGEWRWTLYAGNHKSIAIASEGYDTEASCDHSIELVKGCSNAPVKKR